MITYTRKEERYQINIALIGHLSEANIMAIISATESYLLNTDLPIYFTVDCTQLTTRLNFVNKKRLGSFFNEFASGRIEKIALIYTAKQMGAVETALLTEVNTVSPFAIKLFLAHDEAEEWFTSERNRTFLSFQHNQISVIQTETGHSEIIAGTTSDIFSGGIVQDEPSTLEDLKEEQLLAEEDLDAASQEMERIYEESVHAEGTYCSKHDDSLLNLGENGHEDIFAQYEDETALPENTILFKGASDSCYEIELINDPFEKYFSAVS